MSSNAIRWSPEQLANHEARKAAAAAKKSAPDPVAQAVRLKKFQALGRLPKGTMNKTETAYAAVLDDLKLRGLVLDWKFHPMNVRLAKNTFYEVDFLVLKSDMKIEIHETKGEYTTEKGQMKIKICAEALPWFTFVKCIKLSAKNGGGWRFESFLA